MSANTAPRILLLLLSLTLLLSTSGCSNRECSYDADCSGESFCQQGVCSRSLAKSCKKNGDCAQNERCIAFVCRAVVCETGQQQPCYEGPAATRNKGECRSGKQLCEKGQWTICLGQRVPSKEVCDGKDNDCNGKVDDAPGGCGSKNECKEGASRECYTGPPDTRGKGVCKAGKEFCQQGQWAGCINSTTPSKEVCGDQKDNDCDGTVDNGCGVCKEGASRDCYNGPAGTKGVGECKGGTQTCQQGQWGACVSERKPTAETCDKKDNDCNGKVDDSPNCNQGECISGSSRVCYNGPPGTQTLGVCRPGTQLCQNKKWGACNGEVRPASKETCGDKQDNNCNGQVDEGCGVCKSGDREVCYTATSGCRKQSDGSYACNAPCKSGVRSCQSNGQWGACQGAVAPTSERCNDKIDNDCDGQVDEGCTSNLVAEGGACDGKLCISTALCTSFGLGFPSVCLRKCATSSCPSGFDCVPLRSGDRVCIQKGCSKNSDCRFQNPSHVCAPPQNGVRYCVPGQLTGSLAFGAKCDEKQIGFRCQKGLVCLKVTGATYGICSKDCSTNTTCPSFPSGARCVATTSVTSYCLFPCPSCPSGLKCNTSVNYCFP